MKLISINVELNKNYKTVFDLLKKENPDVVCVQELLEEDLDIFKKELDMEGVISPHRYLDAHTRFEGMHGKRECIAIFAKNIFASGSVYFENKEEDLRQYVPGGNNKETSVFVWVDVRDDSGKTYKFITTHLPVTKDGESTPYQLEVIDMLLGKLKNIPEFILCGDSNSPRGRESFARIANKYKDNIPSHYQTSIDQNLHRVPGLQRMVDCLFTTPGYIASEVKLVEGVSDHMAVVADINKT